MPDKSPIDPSRAWHSGAVTSASHGAAPPVFNMAEPDMGIIGSSPAIARLRGQIRRVAAVDAPVLIWGESGSGKELAAQAIHGASRRAHGPFVAINCGAIPPSLIQSELFGHERGAFTGATRARAGLIESALGGTVFLDEIADLPREQQANLLRFLQEKTIYRVGGTRSITADVRVIAASHVNLQQAVAEGCFREDLYYRLSVLPLDVPPLRARRADLQELAEHIFRQHAGDAPARLAGFSSGALTALHDYAWPGNVRELINRIRRAVVMAEGRYITADDLGLGQRTQVLELDGTRGRAEREAVAAAMARNANIVSRAARDLGISRTTLYRLLGKHGLAPRG